MKILDIIDLLLSRGLCPFLILREFHDRGGCRDFARDFPPDIRKKENVRPRKRCMVEREVIYPYIQYLH